MTEPAMSHGWIDGRRLTISAPIHSRLVIDMCALLCAHVAELLGELV
jgi:hypothetical protein